jgi:hypothetical protein
MNSTEIDPTLESRWVLIIGYPVILLLTLCAQLATSFWSGSSSEAKVAAAHSAIDGITSRPAPT